MIEIVRQALTSHRAVEHPLDRRREAAVMLLLQPRADAHDVLFQLRTHQVRFHRGEISLPGGRRDPDDATLLDTALRETHEEIGVPPGRIEVLGRLDDELTRGSNFRVTPFVGLVRDGPGAVPYARATREVHELLHVPLSHLLSEESRTWKVVDRDGVPEATEAFQYGDHVIWGATARVLGGFLRLVEAATVESRA